MRLGLTGASAQVVGFPVHFHPKNRALERKLLSGTHVGSVSRICLVEWGLLVRVVVVRPARVYFDF